MHDIGQTRECRNAVTKKCWLHSGMSQHTLFMAAFTASMHTGTKQVFCIFLTSCEICTHSYLQKKGNPSSSSGQTPLGTSADQGQKRPHAPPMDPATSAVANDKVRWWPCMACALRRFYFSRHCACSLFGRACKKMTKTRAQVCIDARKTFVLVLHAEDTSPQT
jgi:hypothetical protein